MPIAWRNRPRRVYAGVRYFAASAECNGYFFYFVMVLNGGFTSLGYFPAAGRCAWNGHCHGLPVVEQRSYRADSLRDSSFYRYTGAAIVEL
jgi:hypothetical protein